MHVVVGVDVIVPRNIFDLELGFGDSTDEAVTRHFLFDVFSSLSLVGERINDDTEEDVHQDNVDDHEEGEIKCVSEVIELVRLESLPESITDTTTTSHSETRCGHQAVDEGGAVHVVCSTW